MRMVRHRGLTLTAMAIATIGIAVTVVVRAAESRRKVTWLESQSSCVRLEVRGKSGIAGTHQVTFEVTESDGTKYLARKSVTTTQSRAFVYFPGDFSHHEKSGRWWNAAMVRGQYSWTAQVKGRVIAKGGFTVSHSGWCRTRSGYHGWKNRITVSPQGRTGT
jgi:hypothetical protein